MHKGPLTLASGEHGHQGSLPWLVAVALGQVATHSIRHAPTTTITSPGPCDIMLDCQSRYCRSNGNRAMYIIVAQRPLSIYSTIISSLELNLSPHLLPISMSLFHHSSILVSSISSQCYSYHLQNLQMCWRNERY